MPVVGDKSLNEMTGQESKRYTDRHDCVIKKELAEDQLYKEQEKHDVTRLSMRLQEWQRDDQSRD